METVEKELQNPSSHSSKSDASDPVLRDLWSKIQRGEADARERKQSNRANRSAASDGDSDLSGNEDGAPEMPYSLQTLASTVQQMHRRTMALQQEKDILRRQIKQQREIRGSGDSSNDSEVARLKAELEQTDAEATKAREEVTIVMDRLEAIQAQHVAAESRITGLESSLAEAKTVHETVQSKHTETSAQLAAKEKELESVESEVARLQTDVTFAKAELDAAYGSRAQRAADAAASPAFQKEIDELSEKNKTLQGEIEKLNSSDLKERVSVLEKELGDTIAEYEVLTKQSIEFERERESLEQSVDKHKERCENLESQLSEEKLKWMGMKPPGKDGSKSAESTSTMVLRNEFKKMMKDTRADHTKVLKVCYLTLFTIEDESIEHLLIIGKPTGRTRGTEKARNSTTGSQERDTKQADWCGNLAFQS